MTESLIWQHLDRIQSLAAAAKLTGHGCSAIDAILTEVISVKGLLASVPGTMAIADLLSAIADLLSIKHPASISKALEHEELMDIEREIEQRR